MSVDYSNVEKKPKDEWHPLAHTISLLEDVFGIKDVPPTKRDEEIIKVEWNKFTIPKARAELTSKSIYLKNKIFGASMYIPKAYANLYHLFGIKGAASSYDSDGTTRISVADLREMVDPYDSNTRKDFSELALNNAVIAPGLERRSQALFEDGFELVLEDKEQETEQETKESGAGKDLSKGEQAAQGNIENVSDKPKAPVSKLSPEFETAYSESLAQIKSWTDERQINLMKHMRTANHISIVQGRHAILIFPPISQLLEEKLPDILKTIPPIDMKHPIVDTGLTWAMVALRVELGKKQFLLPDELVYITRRDDGLRKDSAYYGASTLEPIITLARIFNRLINHNFAKIGIAAIYPKQIIEVMTRGSELEQKTQLETFGKTLLDKANDILILNAGTKATSIPVKIETEALKLIFTESIDLIITNIGVTKSMMMRELNMNRDIATVQEIAFEKYIRKQDEVLISQEFENQLLNPLLAHLNGVTVGELPVRVKIKRIEHRDTPAEIQAAELAKESADEINTDQQENLKNRKEKEIASGDQKQKDAKNPVVGASAIQIIKQMPASDKEIEIMEQDAKTRKELVKEMRKLNEPAT